MAPAVIVSVDCASDMPAEPHVQIVRAVVESLTRFSENYTTIMLLQHGFDVPDYYAIYDLMMKTYDPNNVREIINCLGIMFEANIFLLDSGSLVHNHDAGSRLNSFVVAAGHEYRPGFYETPLVGSV